MSKRLFPLIAVVALFAGLGTGCATDSMGPDQQQLTPPDQQQLAPTDGEPLNDEETQGSDA